MDKFKIKLKSFDSFILDRSIYKIIQVIRINNVNYSGPIPLPVKKEKITILRATHKFKDSREQFERVTFTRLLYLNNPTNKCLKDLSNLVLSNGVYFEIKKVK